jgi:hypothetical protein
MLAIPALERLRQEDHEFEIQQIQGQTGIHSKTLSQKTKTKKKDYTEIHVPHYLHKSKFLNMTFKAFCNKFYFQPQSIEV